MATPGRREEYAATTRAAIVDAAVELFAAHGFAGTSVDAVARAARVTKGGVYHHFKDKAELFEAAFVTVESQLLERLQSRVAGLPVGWELVEAGIGDYLTACREDAFRRIALEDAPVALGWHRWRELEEDLFLGTATALLDGLCSEGLITSVDVSLTARMLLGALTEAGLAVAGSADWDTERARATTLILQFLRGLEPPSS